MFTILVTHTNSSDPIPDESQFAELVERYQAGCHGMSSEDP